MTNITVKEVLEAREKDKQEFLSEYKKLIDKYNFDFVAFPQCVPDDQGFFRLTVVTDLVDKTKNSNFIS